MIRNPTPHLQHGMSMLEILITIVILSLGLLGMAGLQVTGLKNNRDAYYGTLANQQIQTMAEIIHSDLVNMRNGEYDSLGNCGEGETCTGECPAPEEGNEEEEVCPMRQQWLANVAAALPGGAGRVRETAAGANSFYIAVRWGDPQLNGATSWGADTTTNPATAACGDPAANTRCLYIQYQP